jgi:hypothetical protein
MTTRDTPAADDSAHARTVPLDPNSRVALGQLRQAYTCAQDAEAELWDFALEIGRLFDAGLTISDLRWLVAKRFVQHGQESSVYGGPHRLFRRGAGFFFENSTCVVLTPSGAAFVDHLLRGPVVSQEGIQPLADEEAAPPENGHLGDHHANGTTHVAVKPSWNPTRRELSLNGTVVKRFRVPAPNQELILSAFEEEGWPDHIDDPLPVSDDIDPPTRLHDAINRLNGCQTPRLLRFSGNGTGDGVRWEFRQAAGVPPNRQAGTGDPVRS